MLGCKIKLSLLSCIPLLTNHEVPDGPLRHEQPVLVVVELLVDPPGVVRADGALHLGHQLVDLVVSDLLHQTQDTYN